jgi:hypothetical protein
MLLGWEAMELGIGNIEEQDKIFFSSILPMILQPFFK